MKKIILNIMEESLRLKRSFNENNIAAIIEGADMIATGIAAGLIEELDAAP